MSEQEYRIERCAGLLVYIPIKKQAEVIQLPLFGSDWSTELPLAA